MIRKWMRDLVSGATSAGVMQAADSAIIGTPEKLRMRFDEIRMRNVLGTHCTQLVLMWRGREVWTSDPIVLVAGHSYAMAPVEGSVGIRMVPA